MLFAYAFHLLEFENNRNTAHKYHYHYEELLSSQDDYQHEEELEEFIDWLVEKGHCTVRAKGHLQWDFLGSLFYALTLASGIGYGSFGPGTLEGQMLTIFYSILSLPLFVYCVGTLADSFKHLVKLLPLYPLTGATTTLRMRRLLFNVVLFTFLVFLWIVGIGGFIFPLLSRKDYDWSVFDGVYFGYITLSTIGFGDMVFSLDTARGAGIVFVLVGIAIFGLWITFMTQLIALGLAHAQSKALNDLSIPENVAALFSADELLVAHGEYGP